MTTSSPSGWSTGVALIVGCTGRTIRVACPHCDKRHIHSRDRAGSHHVIAGCHQGHSRCREYAIPDLAPRPTPDHITAGQRG